jgi:hypothetical protein
MDPVRARETVLQEKQPPNPEGRRDYDNGPHPEVNSFLARTIRSSPVHRESP